MEGVNALRRGGGDTLAVQKDLPYQGLSSFGTGFLSRCGEVWEVEHTIYV